MREVFYKVLLGAGLVDREMKAGHGVCLLDTGFLLGQMDTKIKVKMVITPSNEHIKVFSRSLTEIMFGGDCPSGPIVVIMDLQDCDWEMMLVTTNKPVEGGDDMVPWFGDSLRLACPLYYPIF